MSSRAFAEMVVSVAEAGRGCGVLFINGFQEAYRHINYLRAETAIETRSVFDINGVRGNGQIKRRK